VSTFSTTSRAAAFGRRRAPSAGARCAAVLAGADEADEDDDQNNLEIFRLADHAPAVGCGRDPSVGGPRRQIAAAFSQPAQRVSTSSRIRTEGDEGQRWTLPSRCGPTQVRVWAPVDVGRPSSRTTKCTDTVLAHPYAS
jgi:hypothetical protein